MEKTDWASETMQIINRLTPDIKDKSLDPDWFLLRQRLEAIQQAATQATPSTPDATLPPLGDGPRRKMVIEIEVSADFEKRLDNQWMVEREIHADRWGWRWKDDDSRRLLYALKCVLDSPQNPGRWLELVQARYNEAAAQP